MVRGTVRIAALVAFAVASGYLVPHVNERWLPSLGSSLERDQVIAFLSSVSTGMMAFTGIVFSLLLVLLQFGTAAYTPRIAGIWVKDRTLADAAGVFTGTFFYSLMALRGVGLLEGSRSSALAMYVAFLWLLASVVLLIRLLRVFAGLTHTEVLYVLGEDGQKAIERIYPALPLGAAEDGPFPPIPERATQVVVHEGPPLYLAALDVERLVRLAFESLAIIRIPFARGDSVAAGAVLAFVYGAGEPVPVDLLREAVTLARERALHEDPKYPLRLLVDLALRALSPAVNDPTTAVQALDQIETLLARLGNVTLDVGRVRDSGGELRLVYDATSWEDYLELALSEIQHYGAACIQVERRLAALFEFLRQNVHESRREAIDVLEKRRSEAVTGAFTGALRGVAAGRDRQGLGHSLR